MRRPRMTYANVISSLALFIALGGVSWAAIKIPANSVGTTQIKTSGVTSSDIKNGQVKEADLATGAVSAKKLKAKAIQTTALADGAVGSGQLADGSVGGTKLTDGSVSTGRLADQAVTTSKLGDGSVSLNKMGDNSVAGGKIIDGTVSSSDIADGTIIPADLGGDLVGRAEAAYASIDGFGPTIQQPYNKNVISVTRNGGAGRYCLNVDWAAAGRSPAQQATPVIVTPRSVGYQVAGDVYNPSCANNGVSISLNNAAGTPTDGWVHVLLP